MRYEVITDLTIAEALEQAKAYFGQGGEGLQLISETRMGLRFQGGGGHVTLTATPGTTGTVLDLETREWDYPVQQFMTRVSKRRHWWTRWWRRKKLPVSSSPRFTIINNPPDHKGGQEGKAKDTHDATV